MRRVHDQADFRCFLLRNWQERLTQDGGGAGLVEPGPRFGVFQSQTFFRPEAKLAFLPSANSLKTRELRSMHFGNVPALPGGNRVKSARPNRGFAVLDGKAVLRTNQGV